ncbi:MULTISPECIES: helix-turn-helix domain-containing protein [Fructobacillus]|uniref:helix-turn-helix domain-containing protein n=1 Tax=Fructobacillus TaxID=559173 RepID=UPI001941B254|nr:MULTISPECIES: helix-turn-helix transcriptional regulator [Fructobacillus]MCK8628062.1 helix-turn-helix domain-containing protein [Fructobacillus cardui]GIC69807.1 helix-turn-helix transcriptional regulator [Fructobacillus tropaeoli]CAK1253463.1 Transcriptional regulator [Fructobacillus tropaeoli]
MKQNVGIFIKEYRNRRRLSQTEFAKRAGVTQTIISNLERGQVKSLTTVHATGIAQAMGMTISEFMAKVEV